jgi:beta-lactamase regulating signal transducer with metallopeptidase domain
VLEHERYHVENLDPLKLILAQTLAAAFFFLPSAESRRSRYVADRELAADRRAVEACGRELLASALLKVVGGPEWDEPQDVAAIGGPALLDARVAQLETNTKPELATLDLARAALSIASAALFAASFLAFTAGLGATPNAADLLDGVACAATFAASGFLASVILAVRARRPLPVSQTS